MHLQQYRYLAPALGGALVDFREEPLLVDGVDQPHEGRDVLDLVLLQRADLVPDQPLELRGAPTLRGGQDFVLAHQFLDAVFTEAARSGGIRSLHGLYRFGLAHGNDLHRGRNRSANLLPLPCNLCRLHGAKVRMPVRNRRG